MTLTATQQGDTFVALENGKEWRPYPRPSVKVKNRPFKDMNGEVLTFNSMEHCIGWCNTRNDLMNINHF